MGDCRLLVKKRFPAWSRIKVSNKAVPGYPTPVPGHYVMSNSLENTKDFSMHTEEQHQSPTWGSTILSFVCFFGDLSFVAMCFFSGLCLLDMVGHLRYKKKNLTICFGASMPQNVKKWIIHPNSSNPHTTWQVLNPQPVAHLLGETGQLLLICSSLNTNQLHTIYIDPPWIRKDGEPCGAMEMFHPKTRSRWANSPNFQGANNLENKNPRAHSKRSSNCLCRMVISLWQGSYIIWWLGFWNVLTAKNRNPPLEVLGCLKMTSTCSYWELFSRIFVGHQQKIP